MPEIYQNHYYSSVVLINDQGQIEGIYRKTHLNEQEGQWANAGSEIPVFSTKLGRIGLLSGDEVRIPDLSSLMAVKRADIVIIPSAWSGDYGGKIAVDEKLLTKAYPENTMTFWYNIARYSQAYTLIANFVGGQQKYQGSSAVYGLDPVEAHGIPITASNVSEQGLNVSFDTLGNQNWWMTLSYLIQGRRADLLAPLTLDYHSPCFKTWRHYGNHHDFCWNH